LALLQFDCGGDPTESIGGWQYAEWTTLSGTHMAASKALTTPGSWAEECNVRSLAEFNAQDHNTGRILEGKNDLFEGMPGFREV
jgi:hypothetical protein